LKLQEAKTHPGAATSGETHQYAVHWKLMHSTGCCFEDDVDVKYNKINVVFGPKLVSNQNLSVVAQSIKTNFQILQQSLYLAIPRWL